MSANCARAVAELVERRAHPNLEEHHIVNCKLRLPSDPTRVQNVCAGCQWGPAESGLRGARRNVLVDVERWPLEALYWGKDFQRMWVLCLLVCGKYMCCV